jgi:hypothetical protein
MRVFSAFACMAWSLVLSSCVASRGPIHPASEAGADSGDAENQAETSACTLPAGGNDLSLDVDCTGECNGSARVDFHLDTTSSGYPGCKDGDGNLEFPMLSGTLQSALELGIVNYVGRDTYPIAGKDVFVFGVAFTPDGGEPCDINVVIPDLDVSVDGGGPPTCSVTVTDDCEGPLGHTVKGTIGCTSIPNAEMGTMCTIKNGKFSFGGCP